MHFPKVLERVDSPEQIFHRSFSLGAPDKSASSFDQRWYLVISRKHGIKTTSEHNPKPFCEKYKKSRQKGAEWGKLH